MGGTTRTDATQGAESEEQGRKRTRVYVRQGMDSGQCLIGVRCGGGVGGGPGVVVTERVGKDSMSHAPSDPFFFFFFRE